jgi:hypothetical protein
MTEYEQKSYLDLDSLLEQQKDYINQSNSQASQWNRKSIYMFIKWFIFWILITLWLLVTVYFFSKEKIIDKLTDYDSKSDCMYTKIDDQWLEKQNESELLDVENNIKEEKKIDNDLEDGNLIDNGITFTATPKVYTYWQSIEFKVNNNSNKKITEYSRNFGEIDKHGNESMLLKSQYADSRHIYSSAWIYDVNLVAKYEDNTYSKYQDEVFMWNLVWPIAAFNIKDNRWNKLIRSSYCFSSDEQDVMVGFYPAYTVNRNQEIIIDPSISINEKWTSKWLQYVFEDESIDWNYQKVKVVNQLEKSFSETGCHYVDLTVKDANLWKQDKVRIWFNVE